MLRLINQLKKKFSREEKQGTFNAGVGKTTVYKFKVKNKPAKKVPNKKSVSKPKKASKTVSSKAKKRS